jgi:hypothetical protein
MAAFEKIINAQHQGSLPQKPVCHDDYAKLHPFAPEPLPYQNPPPYH